LEKAIGDLLFKTRGDFSISLKELARGRGDDVEENRQRLKDAGYESNEREVIVARVKRSNATLDMVAWDFVVLGGQRISREAIRLSMRPVHDKEMSGVGDDVWLRMNFRHPILFYRPSDKAS